MIATRLPWPLRGVAEAAVRDFLGPSPETGAARGLDFATPAGEPALLPPEALSWRIFKNPVAVFIGGVAAVILELAEPRVRTGIWEHTRFRDDPVARLRRTGLAAMVTVYGARSVAEAMIMRVNAMHTGIEGVTSGGEPYRASDPELLDWVQATAAFGFAEAYHTYVRPLGLAERDRLLTEGRPIAQAYGATGAPGSQAEMNALFERMRPRLERSDVVIEFLTIMEAAAILPFAARWMQKPLIKAAVAILPAWAREILSLDLAWTPNAVEARLAHLAAGAAERVVIETSPAAQASLRLGLPADWLWRRAAF